MCCTFMLQIFDNDKTLILLLIRRYTYSNKWTRIYGLGGGRRVIEAIRIRVQNACVQVKVYLRDRL